MLGLAGCFSGEELTAPVVIDEGCWVDAAHPRMVCDSLIVPNEVEKISGTIQFRFNGAGSISAGYQRWDGRRYPLYRLQQDVPVDTVFSGATGSITFFTTTNPQVFPNPAGKPLKLYIEHRGGAKVELIDTDMHWQ